MGDLGGRAFGSADGGGASYGGNGGAFEQNRAVLDGRAASGVDEAVGGEYDVGGLGGHGLCKFPLLWLAIQYLASLKIVVNRLLKGVVQFGYGFSVKAHDVADV